MKTTSFFFFLSALFMGFAAFAQLSINITSCMDNTIYSESGTVSNGKGDYLIVGKTDATFGNSIRRSLIRFDFELIPSNATIVSVELRIFGHLGSGLVQLHQVLTPWGEGDSDAVGTEFGGATALAGDATWINSKFNTDNWTSPGGDYNLSPSATAFVSAGNQAIFSSTAMVAEVQSWITGGTNNGWMLIGNELTNGSALSLKSSDIAIGIPYVNVVYTLPPNQVLLNEVHPNGQKIEFFNPGPGAVDISDWYLCNGVEHEKISSINGSTIIPEKGFLQMMWNKITDVVGELALMKSKSFTRDVIEDYVQYGSANQAHAEVAVLGGVWDNKANYVASPMTGSGIGLTGMGYPNGTFTKSSDWAEQNLTLGVQNICDISAKLIGNVSTGLYKATDIILAGTIQLGASVTLAYNNSVEVGLNSEVQTGGQLQINKVDCPN